MRSEKKVPAWWKRLLRNMGMTFYHFFLERSDLTGTHRIKPKQGKRSLSFSDSKTLLKKDVLGQRGEDEAIRFLKKNGYEIEARNVKFRFGEIDIIAKKGDCVIFVEVKTRQTAEIGGQPYEAVKPAKRRRIISAAEAYIRRFRLSERTDLVYRFDILSIVWPENGEPIIEHLMNAFDASEKYPVCPGRRVRR